MPLENGARVTHFSTAFLFFLPWLPPPAAAPPTAPASAFVEPAAVLLHLSERSLNQILVDTFHANGGPRMVGARARVSSRVSDLRYQANLSDPVLRLEDDGTARLSMQVLDASLRIGRLGRRPDGSGARCEEAGLDVDPGHPLQVDLALDFTLQDRALRLIPRSVEIADLEDRLLLVSPTRCTNSLLPTWFLWWVGKPFIRRSMGNLDTLLLERARKSAARLESKEDLVSRDWGTELRLFPGALDTRGGSLLVGLTASSAEIPAPAAAPGGLPAKADLPAESFLGISESLVNEASRRIFSGRKAFHARSSLNAQRLLSSDAVYALIPGLRTVGAREQLEIEVTFGEAPRLEFGQASDGEALIRVLVSGVDLHILRHEEGKAATRLGTLHIASGRMGAVPFANVLGGISFRLVENRWTTSSSGLEFDDEMVAATLQEIAFGKVFETSYAPVLTRHLHIGDTEFVPRSFTSRSGYLVIGLGERSLEVARRTDSLPASR